MVKQIKLPSSDGSISTYSLREPRQFNILNEPLKSRKVYSAAHVVANPLYDPMTNSQSILDWEKTLEYRRYLWSLGLSIAEVMDTSQRGMGLDWDTAKELIKLSIEESKVYGGDIACGAGTDQLLTDSKVTVEDVKNAYLEQCELIESYGGKIILMASRALAACAKGPEDYINVYSSILRQVRGPIIIHWLGEMFDPALAGYWGHTNIDDAMQVVLKIIKEHEDKIEGIKISLLDPEIEIKMRRLLPKGVRMYTGDDFNYPSLIKGDELGHSDALLGIFDAIAPTASAAIQALDKGDIDTYDEIFAPTIPLSRHIFQTPTYNYKTGVVFMAYLNGHQNHFKMVGGMESARSILHLTELFKLADQAGLLRDPELAINRMNSILTVAGVNQI